MKALNPNPVEYRAPSSTRGASHDHRNVLCPRYRGCLDLALAKGWDDFSCRRCPLFQTQDAPEARDFALLQPEQL